MGGKPRQTLRAVVRAVLNLDWSYSNHGPPGAYDRLQEALDSTKVPTEPEPDRWWCSEGCGFVDKHHRCEQWCQAHRIPGEAIRRIKGEC